MGLVPVPYRSDQRVQDQGISRAGRPELPRIALQLAWGALATDERVDAVVLRRFGPAGGRSKRVRDRGPGAETGHRAWALCGARGRAGVRRAEGVEQRVYGVAAERHSTRDERER